jgi:hypothetical protein
MHMLFVAFYKKRLGIIERVERKSFKDDDSGMGKIHQGDVALVESVEEEDLN